MSVFDSIKSWGTVLALPVMMTLVGCGSPQKPEQAEVSPTPVQHDNNTAKKSKQSEVPQKVAPKETPKKLVAKTDDALLPPGIDAAEASKWKLVWRDEFDGSALDTTKWDYRFLGPREGSMISKECITVENGMAHIWVKEKDGVLHNGMIGTQKKFEPLYGIIAGRIKFPRQQGQHGSLWMQPAKGEKVPDDPSRSGAEIDIIEWFGVRWDASTASNLYWPGLRDGKFDAKGHHAGGTKDFKLLPEGKVLSDDFHVFSVEWSPQGYVFRMDGHETYRIAEGVSQVPQYLILSLFTADWEAPRLDRSKLPNSMDVDWVRVWQTDSSPVTKIDQR